MDTIIYILIAVFVCFLLSYVYHAARIVSNNDFPKRCNPLGSLECQKKCHINDDVVMLDICIADIVLALNQAGIKTTASCCGHANKRTPGFIDLEDGRSFYVFHTKVVDDKTERIVKGDTT
jgi:hypothetical protein